MDPKEKESLLQWVAIWYKQKSQSVLWFVVSTSRATALGFSPTDVKSIIDEFQEKGWANVEIENDRLDDTLYYLIASSKFDTGMNPFLMKFENKPSTEGIKILQMIYSKATPFIKTPFSFSFDDLGEFGIDVKEVEKNLEILQCQGFLQSSFLFSEPSLIQEKLKRPHLSNCNILPASDFLVLLKKCGLNFELRSNKPTSPVPSSEVLDSRVSISISKTDGIYKNESKGHTYPLSQSTKRFKVIKTLVDSESLLSGTKLYETSGYKDIQTLSKEIGKINDLFKEKLFPAEDSPGEFIITVLTGGYMLNTKVYKIKNLE